MTVQEYLENKTLTTLHIAEGVLLGITTEENGQQQVDSDTSSLTFGLPVLDVTDFTISGSVIETGSLSYDFSVLELPPTGSI